jgi:hypothetical protein
MVEYPDYEWPKLRTSQPDTVDTCTTEQVNVAVITHTCIRVALGSNPRRITPATLTNISLDFPRSVQMVSGIFFSSPLLPFGSLLHFLEHRADFSVSWLFTDGRTPWTGDQLVARPLPKQRKTHTHIKHPFPDWDSNPRSRPPSERRQFMP